MHCSTKPRKNVLTRLSLFFASALALILGMAPLASAQAARFPVRVALASTFYNSDWTSYLGDATNTNYNSQETAFNVSNVGHLNLVGVANIGDGSYFTHAIITSVLRYNGVLYFGSWDGYEYAVNAHSYHLLWKQFLGIDTAPAAQQCYPNGVGVSSNATIDNGVLFVGGGDGNLYAINAASGTIAWKTQIATPPNEYLWGSPVVGNGHVYIGTASLGDCPLIQAKLEMLDEATGAITATHYTVDTTNPNDIGDSIWSKPVLDATTGSVIFATGNGALGTEPENDAIVVLDWNTLAVKAVWTVPASEQAGTDSDFGSSCMLLNNIGGGQPGVICHDKNGYLYAVTETGTLVWSTRLGPGGQSPEIDQGDITSGTFDGRFVYYTTTSLILNGTTYQSAVYCLDPTTGKVVWVTPIANGFPLTATAGAGNVLVVGMASSNPTQPSNVLVLSMKTGAILFSYALPSSIYGTPTISRAQIYVPTMDGHVYVFGFPPSMPLGDAFTGPVLGPQWTWVNQDATHERLTGTALQIDSAGQYNINAKNFLTETAPQGDFTLTARLSFDPTSQYMEVAIAAYEDPTHLVKVDLINTGTPTNPVEMFEITSQVGSTFQVGQISASGFDLTKPFYLQLTRISGIYYGFASQDGAHWLRIGYASAGITPVVLGLSAFYNQLPMQTATFYSCVLNSI
jgi:outer membrane protein assembly factor BamB